MSTTKMFFHGSDIEKICEVYHLKQENIVKFGANVNPLGLSENVKNSSPATWTSCLLTRTETTPLFAIQSQTTATSLPISSFPETDPAS